MTKHGWTGSSSKQAISWLFSLALFLVLFGTQSKAEPDIEAIHKTWLDATVRVEAHGFAASGFVYGDNDRQVVTNLHAVLPRQGIDKTSIKVLCNANADTAKVVRVLREADLVILETVNLSLTDMGCKPVEFTVAKPKAKEILDVFGYLPENASGPSQKETKKQSLKKDENLENMVGEKLRSTVRELAIPHPKLPLYHVGGGLFPGYSGGPVINGHGQLIGVADGGLDSGLKMHAWVIPASNLKELLESTTSTLPNIELKRKYNFGFSGSIPVGSEANTVVMHSSSEEPYQFVYIKTRTLEEIIRTADPKEGLDELVRDLLPEIETKAEAELAFDIYQELDLGLIVAVPQGRALVYDKAEEALALEGGEDGNTRFNIAHDHDPGYAGGLGSSAHDVLQNLAMNDSQFACNSEDGSQYECELSDITSFDYGDAGLMVRYGYTVMNQRTGEADYYYNSLVNRGADLFFVRAQIGVEPESAVARCYEQGTESACGEPFWNAAALLIATQLTTVDGLLSPTENASVQTLVADTDEQEEAYSNSYAQSEQGEELSSAGSVFDAVRVFYFASNGYSEFAYLGGEDWLINIGGQMVNAVETNREALPDGNVNVTLSYGTSWYLVPLGGGSAFSAAAGQQQWMPFKEVYPQQAAYLTPDGQLAFVYVGGSRWLINLDGQIVDAAEVNRENVPGEGAYVTLQYELSWFRLPLAGGDVGYLGSDEQDQPWQYAGEVILY